MAIFARVWMAIHGSFWFIPTLLAIFLSLAAIGAQQLEAGWVFGEEAYAPALGVDGARTLLSTIAGGMMTVASIVISLTFVALTTMSSQLGPRILLFFMHDRPTQFVIGAFVGTFLFALISLTATGGPEDNVPLAALAGAVALAVLSFGLMVYYVHHVAASIQADVLVARLGEQLITAIDDLAEGPVGAKRWQGAPQERGDRSTVLAAPASGYLTYVEREKLLAAAREIDGRIELLARPADFVIEGVELLRVWSREEIDEARILNAITLGPNRTPLQQAHFEFAALTEVAVRALSPGINDPYTAVSCIDRLTQGLAHAARRGIAGDLSHREDGKVLLVERRHSFADYINTAFAPIRQHARTDALVARRMASAYIQLSRLVEREDERGMLRAAAKGFRDDLAEHMSSDRDRKSIVRDLDEAIEALAAPREETTAESA